ncbi:TIGR02221 family CRISPR-associated protein [Ferrovum myxofaciens]|uniref:TIGR02221 family CRISPR-associated protein n=1 Tax=Ferrovum myxofaciens TaxID=416213 RepID=A0A9E6MVD9_9PROT|nr:TIGR02221 family CRISPR-associated protein [Ferrovum myxofaciens]MBU6995022.1 TIGR02221 family CRISPR-associated protein [Ferrovum myxofaciens]QKE38822.1 MAG: TIGR02221 family CRISPR-associated protein [Ferrovum myxofaciens]QKE41409.1 MAG: TIGR02221 family CRISPR-associated protein [Ferrovum myxofaciens]QWY74032.1 MAG: TIGR02221 family CRISPR-associated protein [Ferrovum myxofaciens]QWY76784.1 MAG: TIGR02221 family CRISPR-associated protein [Ferrovum myxofaciens]
MNTTLVSFLGRNTVDPRTGYRCARYRFTDGSEFETPFFGLALAQKFQPERMVILGTSGSMWDMLIGHLSPENEDLWEKFMVAAQEGQVTDALLALAQPIVESLLGYTVVLRIIPFGRDTSEQIAILQTIGEVVPKSEVILDLTHGFRHLAALGLLSAFFIERVANVDVTGLYYGALDMTVGGITPVVQLDGLLTVERWINALNRFDQSGDYGVFSPLLQTAGIPADKARCLEDAAFHERTFNLSDAARKLGTVLPLLDHLQGPGILFKDNLLKRLAWARTGTLFTHQKTLALTYLERKDFVRATVFGWEAFVTRECTVRGLNPNDFNGGRDQALKLLKSELKLDQFPQGKIHHYNILKNLRNALAHGTPPKLKEIRRLMLDPDDMTQALNTCFMELLEKT